MNQVVAVDIGGTHARFALAELQPGRRPALGRMRKYRTADHAGLASAWAAFGRDCGGVLPAAAAIAIAGPVDGELIRFTNNPWLIRPATIGDELGLDRDPLLLNDFAAMAAGIGVMDDSEFDHLGGTAGAWPGSGVTTVIGPGTGLGVAQLLRTGGRNIVIASEGGHVDFAALDGFEEALAQRLRAQHGRVSAERVCAGPALAAIREALAANAGRPIVPVDDAALWQLAIDGADDLAAQALDRLVMALGSFAGDLALAHGANAVAITGGLANRIRDRLAGPLFHDRFRAKGRFARRMAELPIRLACHPEPGLLGAAAAYQEQRC
ncbi:glucokinase [Sphingomonas sp. MMS24-J13]|uniref:glucokinase n=1 Tax=Sphingomonas sp. MMS24-J13 TaxID=3238686 RepID=UPI00384DA957